MKVAGKKPLDDPDLWWKAYEHHYATRSWSDYRHLMAEFVSNAPGPPLLDVGCGQGFLLECARQFGLPAIGLEGSAAALDKCRELHPQVDARLWRGGEALPLPSGSIGGAVLNEFVDHIHPEQNEALFQELARVVRPGGALIVKSPSRHNRFDDDEGHVSFFSPSEFRAFVEKHSFEVVAQPFIPQPLLGPSGLALRLVRLAARIAGKERMAARIDLVARRRSGAV